MGNFAEAAKEKSSYLRNHLLQVQSAISIYTIATCVAMVSLKAMPKEAKSKKKAIDAKKAPKPEPTYKSTEFIEDSDQEEDDKNSDEESEQESDKKEASPSVNNADVVPKLNGKFVAPDGSSSSSENESDSDDQEEESSSDDEDTEETEASEPTEEAKAAAEPVK